MASLLLHFSHVNPRAVVRLSRGQLSNRSMSTMFSCPQDRQCHGSSFIRIIISPRIDLTFYRISCTITLIIKTETHNVSLEGSMKELSKQEIAQIAAKKHSNNTSGYRGVSWHKVALKWQVHIGVNGGRVYLGLFEDEIDAARAYDEAAKEHFGKYAALNLPTSNTDGTVTFWATPAPRELKS